MHRNNNSVIKAIVSLVLIVFILSGCNSLQDKLDKTIKQQCNNRPGCKITLKDVTKFDWDKMYIFGSWTEPDSISKAIGFKYEKDGTYDDTQRILFTYGNKVVYEENLDYLNGARKVLFNEIGDSLLKRKAYYTPSEAIFKVDADPDKDFAEYYLTRIKNK